MGGDDVPDCGARWPDTGGKHGSSGMLDSGDTSISGLSNQSGGGSSMGVGVMGSRSGMLPEKQAPPSEDCEADPQLQPLVDTGPRRPQAGCGAGSGGAGEGTGPCGSVQAPSHAEGGWVLQRRRRKRRCSLGASSLAELAAAAHSPPAEADGQAERVQCSADAKVAAVARVQMRPAAPECSGPGGCLTRARSDGCLTAAPARGGSGRGGRRGRLSAGKAGGVCGEARRLFRQPGSPGGEPSCSGWDDSPLRPWSRASAARRLDQQAEVLRILEEGAALANARGGAGGSGSGSGSGGGFRGGAVGAVAAALGAGESPPRELPEDVEALVRQGVWSRALAARLDERRLLLSSRLLRALQPPRGRPPHAWREALQSAEGLEARAARVLRGAGGAPRKAERAAPWGALRSGSYPQGPEAMRPGAAVSEAQHGGWEDDGQLSPGAGAGSAQAQPLVSDGD